MLSDTLRVKKLQQRCSAEFQQSQTELRQHLERSITAGDQFRNLFVRKPKLRIPVLHQKLLADELEKNNSSPTSRRIKIGIRSWKELEGQWQNLRQENARVNGRMHQIQSTNNSMGTRNKDLTQQSQTHPADMTESNCLASLHILRVLLALGFLWPLQGKDTMLMKKRRSRRRNFAE